MVYTLSQSNQQWHIRQKFHRNTNKTSGQEISAQKPPDTKQPVIETSGHKMPGHEMSRISLTIFTTNAIRKMFILQHSLAVVGKSNKSECPARYLGPKFASFVSIDKSFFN